MTSPLGKTLGRFNSASRNLLLNPYFEHIDVPTVTANVGTQFLPTPDRNLFRAAPGWFTYGASEYGSINRPNNYDFSERADNPFASRILGERVNPTPTNAGSNDQRWGNGVVITQNQGLDYGIVHPILRSTALERAKRVRISGCYQVLQNDGAGGLGTHTSGLHIFLKKSLKRFPVVSTTVDNGTALTRVDANTVQDLTQNFLSTVTVGDTIAIETVGYFRVTVVVSDTRLDVEPNMGAWAGPLIYRIYKPTTNAPNDHGQRVILPNTVRFAAHLSTKDPDFLHTNSDHALTGTEHLVRAWDYLSSGPAGTLTEHKHLVIGERTAVPGDDLGFRNTGALNSGMMVYALDNAVEVTGTAGDVLYSQDLSNGGTLTPTDELIFFDEVIELDGSTNSDYHGEFFLVVMPVAPSLASSIATTVTVVLWGLHLSIVDSDVEEDSAILSEYASAHRHNSADYDGIPAKYLSAYPMYVPAVYPLKTRFRSAAIANTGVPAFIIAGVLFPAFTFSTNPDVGGDEWYLADQVHLPPGSCVVGGAIPVRGKTGTWSSSMTFKLLEVFTPPPYDPSAARVGNPTYLSDNESLTRVLATRTLVNADADQTIYPFTSILRNRIGLYDSGADGEAIVSIHETNMARLGASSLFLFMSSPPYSAPSGSILQLLEGWIYTVQDPRWGNASTHWE